MASTALTKGALWMQNVDYPASWDRTFVDALYSAEGVISGFAVTPDTGLTIDISAGRAVVQGDEVANQGKYLIDSDAVESLTLASVGADRTEYIFISINDTAVAGGRAGNNVTIESAAALPDSALLLATLTLLNGTATIDAGMIADSRVFADVVAPGSITTAKLADSAVTTAKIDDDAVTTAKIASGAVDTIELATDAVDATKIGSSQVTTVKIDDDAVTQAKIGPLAVGTTELANDAVTNAKIGPGAVGTTELAADAVTQPKIGLGAVGTTELATDAVNGSKIANDSIDSEHYVNGSIDVAHMAANSVDSNQYVNRSIDAIHIATGVITANEMGANSVDTSELATGAVEHAKTDVSAWVTPTLLNGWVTYTGRQGFRYRKRFDEVQVEFDIKNGDTTEGVNIFTLPSGFRPPRSFSIGVYSFEGGPTSGAPSGPNCYVTTGGDCTLRYLGGNTEVAGQFQFSTTN